MIMRAAGRRPYIGVNLHIRYLRNAGDAVPYGRYMIRFQTAWTPKGCGCPVDTSAGGRSTDRTDR